MRDSESGEDRRAQTGGPLLHVGAASGALAAASGESPAGAGGFTYQWRHGGVDLVDDGRITGATTDTLTIANFGPADAGGYNVWVSDGSTRQLSSLAVLQLPPAVPALSPVQLGLAAVGLLLAGARARRMRSAAAPTPSRLLP